MTAYGITRIGFCRIKGQHLSAASNEPEPTEADWIAADLARNVNKGERIAAEQQRRAIEDQVQYMREQGAI